MDAADAKKMGIESSAQRFSATLPLPASQDTVKVTATSASGESATAMAAPRIAQSFAMFSGRLYKAHAVLAAAPRTEPDGTISS